MERRNMKGAIEALALAEDAGIRVTLNGDRLALKAPGEPPQAVRDALRENKDEIIAFLRAPNKACGEYKDAFESFKTKRYSTRFRHDQACWAAEMFLTEWGSLAAEFEWTADDIFARQVTSPAWRIGSKPTSLRLLGMNAPQLGPDVSLTGARAKSWQREKIVQHANSRLNNDTPLAHSRLSGECRVHGIV
jgi:TubC N-terminal docking domain